MVEQNNITAEFLQKLALCIERGDLDACVEEAARVARDMGVEAEELQELSIEEGRNGRYDFDYVIALAVQYLKKVKKALDDHTTFKQQKEPINDILKVGVKLP